MVRVLLEHPAAPLAVVLGQCVLANYSSPSVDGYSAFQRLTGRNPRLPDILDDDAGQLGCPESLRPKVRGCARKHLALFTTDRALWMSLLQRMRWPVQFFEMGQAVHARQDESSPVKDPGPIEDGRVCGQDGGFVLVCFAFCWLPKSPFDI